MRALVSPLYCSVQCFVPALFVLALVVPAHCAHPQVAALRAEYDRISREFAATASDWRPQAPRTGSLLFVAPDEYSATEQGGDRLREARIKYAGSLYNLAKQAADAGQLSLAFQWATETLRENPDHADARRVLGYEQRDGKWLTAYGVKMFDSGKIWNRQRGWIAAKDDKTSPAAAPADAARHADMKHGWQVRTDHFQVTTNHSLAAGAELAARLEHLYQIWRQLFAGFYYSEKEVRGLFAGDRIARVQARPFRVFYHRDRDDYVNALSRRQPNVGETLGIYFDDVREAHFFATTSSAAGGSPASSATGLSPVATLYHEAVHQLFRESKPSVRRIAQMANFWIEEGVATYFETLTEHIDDRAGLYFTIGEPTVGRLPMARQRLREGYFIPLADLTRLGQEDVQRRSDVRKLYGEACSLTAFLLSGADGRYREPLVSYLQVVYTNHDNDESLAEATGASYSELDAAYRQYMESLP